MNLVLLLARLGGWRMGSKDRGTELGAGLVFGQGGAEASQPKQTAKGGGGEGLEELAA